VLKRTGFDKYQKIDVQYSGQVIGVKEKYTKIDSIQLRKNIEGLLQQSRQYNEMVQVAPSLDYAALPEADTASGPQMMYGETEASEDSILYLQDNGEAGEVNNNVAPVAIVKKAADQKAGKPSASATKTAKTDDKKTVTKKPEVKKQTSKTDTKKTDTKSKATVKSGSKTDTKKTVAKKTETSKKTKTTSTSKTTSKKRE
jgi:hypothetical protein